MKHIARKRFGQNFLTDGTVINRIVDAIAPQPDQLIVEIGPGQAALTMPLVESGAAGLAALITAARDPDARRELGLDAQAMLDNNDGYSFFEALGDLIMTGTPSGVGPVSRGDQLHGFAQGIGELHCKVA